MNCQRALEILAGLATHRPAFTADEIEELLKLGLAVEADPRDMATLQWLVSAVQELAGCAIEDPLAPARLGEKLAEIDEQLKSDWYRFATGKDKLAERERERHLVRRALAVLNDKVELARLTRIMADGRQNPDVQYAACEALGSEIYAITARGTRVGRELEARIARFAAQPLAAFLKAFDKAERKMEAFSDDIAQLASGIGPVKKNAHQVVIGLAKTGAPPAEALGLYRHMMHTRGVPDVAVTCARSAAAFGGPQEVAQRLGQAQHALYRAGFPRSPVVDGAAKSLLPFEQLETGAIRFSAIAQQLEAANLTRGEATIKCTARLMPAHGAPQDVVRRAVIAYPLLPANLDREVHNAAAVALASMVKSDDDIPGIVQRFLDIAQELTRRRVSLPGFAVADALECVACPGTPAEVVETVRALIGKLAAGRESRRSDVAIAVAFAKRFAY
ncbi:MAG TPA: hypothetical protein VFT22_05665 [Kofleriaceae bacterium]|nr:hypothetical protein [Kofleriaceae bacterium]